MTTSTDSQQSGGEPDPGRRRAGRRSVWLLGVAGALAVVGIVLLYGGGDQSAGQRDLSTPEGAAEAFASAAAAGDVEGVLAVTCLGVDGCVAEHGGALTVGHVSAAKKVIADHVREIGARYGAAEFTTARAGTEPGTREVDYRLPGSPEGERGYLVFVEYQDRWLYIATGGPVKRSPPPVP